MVNDPLIKRLKGGRVVLTVTFTGKQTKSAEEAALKKLGKDIKIEGFRPGKAPAEMLKERVGHDQLLEEIIRTLLPETIQSLTQEHKLKPIIPPKVEAQKAEPLTLQITFIEHPEVTIKDADKISVEKKESKVDDKYVELAIDHILTQHLQAKEIDRSAQEGDRITMDFWGEDDRGKEIKGTRTTGHQVIIGSKTLVPGFEKELIGTKKGESKTFTITFPKKYHAEKLQGKPVTFHVTVRNIEEVTKPKLTDAFAQEHLNIESAESFKKRIRASMEEQEKRIERQRQEEELLEKIRKSTSVDLAPELVEEEEQDLVDNLSKQLIKKNLTLDDWLKQTGKKAEDIKQEMRKQAEERLTLRLGIQHLTEERGINIPDEEMEKTITDFLTSLSPDERSRIEKMYQKGFQGWHQLKWQKRVERLMEEMLTQ